MINVLKFWKSAIISLVRLITNDTLTSEGGNIFMKKWLFAILFGSALVLGACGGGNDDGNNNNGNNNQEENNGDVDNNNNEANNNNESTDTAAAEELFKNNCASCHGDDLTSGFAPELDQIGSKYDADDIESIIEDGKGQMKPVDVPDEDRSEIAQWLADKE